MSSSQLEVADAAAARSAQFAHSAIQGTLAAQLVAASSTDDPDGRSKISRLVGRVGSKEPAPPSMAIEPPPDILSMRACVPRVRTIALEPDVRKTAKEHPRGGIYRQLKAHSTIDHS